MMDSDKTVLKLRSHNINGFSNSKEFLFHECNSNSFNLLAIQEHWLKPSHRKQSGTNSLKVLHPTFDAYATSGMDSQIGERVLRGRPYGGTGFLFHKSLSKCIRARVDLKHDRVSIMELCTLNEKILLISAYMPYYNTDGILEQLNEYRSTLAFIENVLISHPLHKYILFMDLNCNLFKPSHPYSSLMNSFICDYDLMDSFSFCPGFNPDRDYTRFDIKRKSFTLIDGIIISKSLSHIISDCRILHPPTNVSDHLPIELTVDLEITDFFKDESTVSNYIPWSSLSLSELTCYRDSMSAALADISIPFHVLNHSTELCDNCDCLILLEKLHEDIVLAVARADQCLPRKKHGISKPYWSSELSELKQKSFDAHELWRSCNCPRSGPIFDEKQRCSYAYKRYLRKS